MRAKDFKALLAELGSLTPVQRNTLMTALSSQRSAGDVVALIEAEFAKAPACGHCGWEAFSKWGVATGLKRYMCKACERTFNALTGTLCFCAYSRITTAKFFIHCSSPMLSSGAIM